MTTLYLLVTHYFPPTGEVGGTLYDHEGKGLWGHMSSSMDWLIGDLTVNFSERAQKLSEKYPEGFELVIVGEGDKAEYEELSALWDKYSPGWRAE